jgi:uncharacterized protein YcaQ
MAIAAQGLHRPRPTGRVDVRHLRRVFGAIDLIQIDSVNVVARAHRLTLFARLGPYDPGLIARAFGRRELFEYWGHEASLIPISDWPLYRHRMETMGTWRRYRKLFEEHPGYVDSVLDEIRERGPLSAGDLADPGDRLGPWWGWSNGKAALEWLFSRGEVTVAERRNFTRYYDLPERVIPPEVLAEPVPTEEEAHRALVLKAARSLGVATARDLADYHRIDIKRARRVVDDLAGSGELERVEVEGWEHDGFIAPGALVPRSSAARTLLGPFDSLIWNRDRVERLWGFRYRIEIYVPAAERVHGYYVLPFLLGDDLAARVDLKADRQAGVLRVRASYLEEGRDRTRVARELADELADLTRWLGLGGIVVEERGDLAAPLRRVAG